MPGLFWVRKENGKDVYELRPLAQEIHIKFKHESNFRCQNCGEWFPPRSFKALEVHHIDRNPYNNQKENLIVLCKKCHRERHHGKEWTI